MMTEEVVEHQLDLDHPFVKSHTSTSISGYLDNIPKLSDPSYNWITQLVSFVPHSLADFGKTIKFKLNNNALYENDLSYHCVGFRNPKIKFKLKGGLNNANIREIATKLISNIGIESNGWYGNMDINGLIIPYLNQLIDGYSGFQFEFDDFDNIVVQINIPFFRNENYFVFNGEYYFVVEIGSQIDDLIKDQIKIDGVEIKYEYIFTNKLVNQTYLLNPNFMHDQFVFQNQFEIKSIDLSCRSNELTIPLHFHFWLHSIIFCFTSVNSTNILKKPLFKTVKIVADGFTLCKYNKESINKHKEMSGYYTIPFTKNKIDQYNDIENHITASKIKNLSFVMTWDEAIINEYLKENDETEIELHIDGINYNLIRYLQCCSGFAFSS